MQQDPRAAQELEVRAPLKVGVMGVMEGLDAGRLVASLYEKHFRAPKPCSALEAGSFASPLPKQETGCLPSGEWQQRNWALGGRVNSKGSTRSLRTEW